jgi:hypothetical protein
VVIDEAVSQIKEEKRLALEAANSGNSATQEIYVKSLEALSKREEALRDERKALREKEAKLLDAALVSTKEPSASTFTLIAGCRPV